MLIKNTLQSKTMNDCLQLQISVITDLFSETVSKMSCNAIGLA